MAGKLLVNLFTISLVTLLAIRTLTFIGVNAITGRVFAGKPAMLISSGLAGARIQESSIPITAVEFDEELERESVLKFWGPDANVEGLIWSLGDIFKWRISMVVDKQSLSRCGINLNNMVIPGKFQAAGVSRRSSLRFLLNGVGLGYFPDGQKRLVVTTNTIAKLRWLMQLKEPDPQDMHASCVKLRRDAIFAAGIWQVSDEEWVPLLTTALSDADRQVRFDAAYALGEIGPPAEHAVDALVLLLKSDDLTLREAATYALGRIGPTASKQLLELVNDTDPAIAVAATNAFGLMGSAGNTAVPGLIAAGIRRAEERTGLSENQESRKIYHSIGSALARVELGDALQILHALLTSPTTETRAFAAYAIAKIGPPAQSSASELQKLLGDKNDAVRSDAAYALSQIDLPADTPTFALEAAAKDPDRRVSLWATEALRVINSKK